MKPIKVPTVRLPEAQIRIERFRKQLKGSMPESNIPRAILIPIEDLMAIVNKYQTVDANGDITNTLQGIRAYFAVKITDMAKPDDVTALIVAVDKEGNDIVNNPDTLADEVDGSEIYDFTKPCPDQCDPSSPLFVP